MIRKRKDGFVNYGLDALRNSMVTGIPQIIDATNTPNKILRLLVLVSCLAGFMYQSSDFMDLYWQYKTITDVKVQTTKVAELPSITVCNLNGLYGSRICNDSRFMANCFKSRIDQRSCACFGERFCNNGVPEVIQCVHMKIYDDIKEMKYEDYRMLLQKREEFISNCRLIKLDEKKIFDCDLSYYQHVRCPSSYSGVVEGCYTLNTIIGWPEKKPMTIPTEGIYSFSVFPHAEEYPQYWGVVSAQLSIHSPRQIVNPFTDGFNMNLNTEQTFRLKKVVKKLLPAPYETNCIDYIEMWKKRGGHGPTNQKECFEECQKNISIQFRGCVSSYYNFPRNERTCSSTESAVEVPKSVIAECEKQNCKPACYEESYEVTREVTEKYIRPECSLEKAPDQSIDIEIRMNGMETTTYTYSPKFESVEIFSYIGGYIGIWLGVSLVAAFDFLETTILIMSYPVKNYKEKRKRNRNIETIKKPSMNL